MVLCRFYTGQTKTDITMDMGGVLQRRVKKLYGFAIGGTFIGIMLTERI